MHPLETKMAASTAVATREFPLNEGPFVTWLYSPLVFIGCNTLVTPLLVTMYTKLSR